MTSMELFRVGDPQKAEPMEWGTGNMRAEAKEKVWVAKKPTWQYSGDDITQKYTLTPLKLSHVRMTDQLLPNPQNCNMGPLLINKPFPAEHPYSSHIPKNALIPKFDSPQDPKRGVQARNQPINNEMPANPYDVTIVSKTKGFGLRHEIQDLPSESEKRPLVWLGENGFDQLVKTHGGRQPYYPYPPKLNCPNLQDRSPEMTVAPRTANTLRNVERGHWQTSYDLAHTGLGDANVMALDNYDEKMTKLHTTGTEDDNLYPRSANTYDPPRPAEGRIARRLLSLPDPTVTDTQISVPRPKTLHEVEECRLLNGTFYVNLPGGEYPDDTDENQSGDECKNNRQVAHATNMFVSAESQPTATRYLDDLKEAQNEVFQQIEAQNRWQDLDLRKPENDIELLNVKYQHLNDTEKPTVFYNHEKNFNEERAGLYQTNYDPYKLYNSLNNNETSGPSLFNTMSSHVEAIHVPSELSEQMKDAAKGSTAVNEQKYIGEYTPPREIILAHESKKQAQKEWLQPSIKTSGVKTQEGETILKNSTHGDSYNVLKFLQEHELPRYAKRDPQQVMSSENQLLTNVNTVLPKSDMKSVRFDDEPRSLRRSGPPNTIQYTSRHAQWKRDNECHDTEGIVPVPGISESLRREKTMPCSTAIVKFSDRRPMSSVSRRNDFLSRSTNIAPTNLSRSLPAETTLYEKQFPGYDLEYKNDSRFNWMPGHGAPRPQTTLLQIQDGFRKSLVHNKFHNTFQETAPDLRHSIQSGKRHAFDGVNAQVLRG